MEYDQNTIVEATITENQYVENCVVEKKKRSLKDRGIDVLDIAIVPAIIGVFVSLGFLFAGLFGGIGPVVSSIGM